jgi:hypothetical protein
VTTWTVEELDQIGHTTELQLASRRPDAGLRPYVTIWVARAGDGIYVRSAHGYDNPWFQHALRSGEGRIRAGGVERDVRLEVPAPGVTDEVSAEYHAKYDRYGPTIVGTVVSPEAERSTLRITPR